MKNDTLTIETGIEPTRFSLMISEIKKYDLIEFGIQSEWDNTTFFVEVNEVESWLICQKLIEQFPEIKNKLK